ncbi:hypothetical protein I4U23_012756 [Adineta vaga]|nr:hypothetical protein I4U23_012756 [Adineta vaga]
MGSYSFKNESIIDIDRLKIQDDDNLQKPNIYIKYLPYQELFTQQGYQWFDEIQENLSRSIQLSELRPGFIFWTGRLQDFITLYGYYFTKIDHLKLVDLYLSMLSITNLDYSIAKLCFTVLERLLRKPKLITRDDLIIDWRILSRWIKLIHNNHDKTHGLITIPKDISIPLFCCVRRCSPYFTLTATREILDEFRPQLYFNDWTIMETMKILQMILPVNLPPAMHDHGYKLWLNEFFEIWNTLYNRTVWELRLTDIFATVAWNNMGYIDWEPWLPQIFTRILRGFSLPVKRQTEPQWIFTLCESYQLTEQNITDFVNCVKEYALISIYNPSYNKEAAEICQYLSMLRPEIIVPLIIEKLFSSLDNMTEPQRFTSTITCLTQITLQMVRQTSSYSQGQTYVIPLLLAVLPGIDLNDMNKTLIEKDVCLSTKQFEDFIVKFLQRIFQIIEILSTDVSEGNETVDEGDTENNTIEIKLISIMSNIVQQCSHKIFQIIRNMMIDFLTCAFLSPKVRKIVAGLVCVIVQSHPEETLEYLLPKTCHSIEMIMNSSDASTFLTDHKGDLELTWYLILFSNLISVRGDILLDYKPMIMSVFQRCISIIEKNAYKAVALAANRLLESLTQIYPIEYQLTLKNINEPFIEFLPIRAWGQHVDLDEFPVRFHIPKAEQIDFAWEFINAFIYSELTLLNEQGMKISKEERLRSLTVIRNIATGCFHMIPPIENNKVENLVSSVVSFDFKYQIQYPIYNTHPIKCKENLRMRLFIDIGKFLDELVENHPDDVKSIQAAHTIYFLLSTYHGVSFDSVYQLSKDIQFNTKLFRNRLSSKRKHLRFQSIKIMLLHMEKFELNNFKTMNQVDKQITMKLFDLSINRYSEVRRHAQNELFSILHHYWFSYEIIVDRLVQLLNSSEEIDHDQIKGCLYIILGNNSFFLPGKNSWIVKEKLWPAIALMNHVNKSSTQTIVNNINNKIIRNFVTHALIQETNELSFQSAVNLWRQLPNNEIETCRKDFRNDIQSYSNLMETLSSFFKRDKLTWKQRRMIMSFLRLLLQTSVPIPLSCIQIFVDHLIHDNTEIRQYATQCIAAICRLQKPPRIIVEKSFQDIETTSALINNTDELYPGDRDNNFWITYDNYKPPKTQIEWEETCFLDKLYSGYYTWPQIIKYSMNKRTRYMPNTMPEQIAILYDRFIDKDFIKRFTELTVFDKQHQTDFDLIRFVMFKGLFRNFGLIFFDTFLEQLYVLIHEETEEKRKCNHRIAAEIVAGTIRGSKYWTLEMLDELWKKLTPFLTEVCTNLNAETSICWNWCFQYSMENTDPRRMTRPINFLCTLMKDQTITNTVAETSLWNVICSLRCYRWRIPSVWREINEKIKDMFDHPSLSIRNYISDLLSIPLHLDLTIFNGKLSRHISINQFIDQIHDRFQQAIELAGKTSLVTFSNETIEMNHETCKAFNFISTVIYAINSVLFWSPQPIKDGIIRIFPYLCEIESLGNMDESLKNSATLSRTYIGMSYLTTHHIEALLEQLEQVSINSKWHTRRAAIIFIQKMTFSNLFNARPYVQRIHTLVTKSLFDEQIEVRIVASVTLAGLYQCGYLQVTNDDLQYFYTISKIDEKKIISTKDIAERHGGILGLCAIVLSSPYDISSHVPNAVMFLCEHSDDRHLIQKSVRQCLSEFRHTHHDLWHEHQQKFTDNQLIILTNTLISHNYCI